MLWMASATGPSAPAPPVALLPFTKSKLKANPKRVMSAFAKNAVNSQTIWARQKAIRGGTPDTSTPPKTLALIPGKYWSKA